MRNIIIIFLILIGILSCKCGVTKNSLELSKVIRMNYFDSSVFHRNKEDTNKYDISILENFFDIAGAPGEANCLVVETHLNHVPNSKYQLYDFKTGKYYSMHTGLTPSPFQENTDTIIIKDLIALKDNQKLLQYEAENSGKLNPAKFEMAYYIVSYIRINKKDIFINSYYLLGLPIPST